MVKVIFFVFSVFYSFTTFAMLTEPNNLASMCQKAKGQLAYELCWCQGKKQQAYFDPYFSVCEDDGPQDIEIALRSMWQESKAEASITDFSSLLAAYDGDLCNKDLDRLKEGALAVLQHTLKERFAITSVYDDGEESFSEKVILLWKKIITAMIHEEAQDEAANLVMKSMTYDLSFEQAQELFLNRVASALREGVIPLPVIDDQAAQQLFRLPSLKKYLLLGVAPVQLRKNSMQEMSLLYAHPFKQAFTISPSRFADHDVQHAVLMAMNWQRLGGEYRLAEPYYFSQPKCQLMGKILHEIPSSLGMMLYYRLHEAPFALGVKGNSWHEFILEKLLSSKKTSLAAIILGQEKSPNSHKLCSEIFIRQQNFNKLYLPNKEYLDKISIFDKEYTSNRYISLIEKISNQYNFLQPFLSILPYAMQRDIAIELLDKLVVFCVYSKNYDISSMSNNNMSTQELSLIDTAAAAIDNSQIVKDYQAALEKDQSLFQKFEDTLTSLPVLKKYPHLLERWNEDKNIWNQTYSKQ